MSSVYNLKDMNSVSLYISKYAMERHDLKEHSLVEEINRYTSELTKLLPWLVEHLHYRIRTSANGKEDKVEWNSS